MVHESITTLAVGEERGMVVVVASSPARRAPWEVGWYRHDGPTFRPRRLDRVVAGGALLRAA
jgi:hypothetical protein